MSLRVRATAILIQDGKILLVQQSVPGADPPRRWSLPGGGLEAGETLEACVVRELREETGLVVRPQELLYLCERIHQGRHAVHITFRVERVGGDLRVGGEPEPGAEPIGDVKMVPLKALCDFGFTERFRDLAMSGFPGKGSYQGPVSTIGL